MTMQTVFKNEKEFEQFKDWTYGVLHDDNIKDLCITFTKKDGTERKMFCTLCEGRIPAVKLPTSENQTTTSQTSGSAVRVFDTEKQEWRSFRWDSVIKVEYSL